MGGIVTVSRSKSSAALLQFSSLSNLIDPTPSLAPPYTFAQEEISPTTNDSFTFLVIPYRNFYDAVEFPRCPLDDHLIRTITRKEALNSFIIFISHVWLRSRSYTQDYCDIPHPDTINHEKFLLCQEGISKLINKNMKKCKEIYIWVDYSCLDQTSYPENCYLTLSTILELSDCIFTPLLDYQYDWSYEETTFGPLVDYKAPALQDGEIGYLNRAWCRLEMFLAANLPIKNSLMRDYLLDRMKIAVLDKRRPHFIYGSRESLEGLDPIELFPLENSSFDKLNPLRGYLTRPSDEPLIEEIIMKQLMPLMARPRPGYVGSRNPLLQKHGRGRYIDESGDIYDGEWYESRRQGKGKMVWSNGDIYVGEWVQNEMCGYGKLSCSNGDVYEGNWKDGMKHGHGVCHFKDSSKYEGNWEANEIHGKGILTYADGSVYQGTFVKSVKEGIGTIVQPNGDYYEGDWSGGYMHGHGVYVHSNGGKYEGEWKYDKKCGYGIYYYPSGAVYEGNWENDKKHGYGILRDPRGGCYDGDWKAGKWKG